MTKIGIVPLCGNSLRKMVGCKCDAAKHIPVLLLGVPTDEFEIVEQTDDRLLIERKKS